MSRKAKVYLCGPTRHSKTPPFQGDKFWKLTNFTSLAGDALMRRIQILFEEVRVESGTGGLHSPVFFWARFFFGWFLTTFFLGSWTTNLNRNGLLDPLLLKFQTCLFWAYGTIIPSLYFCRLLWSYYNKNLWNWPQERIYQKLQEEACQSQYAHALIVGYLNKLLAPHASQDGRILVTL